MVDSSKDQRVTKALARHEGVVMGGYCDLFAGGENHAVLTQGEALRHDMRSGVVIFISSCLAHGMRQANGSLWFAFA